MRILGSFIVRAKALNIIKIISGKMWGGDRIYTGAFKISPGESLHVEANEMGLRFLYKLRSDPTYTESLITQDDTEDYN